jgi:serine/threonine protein kinase
VKVLDFGVAYRSEVQPSRMTRPGIVVGTPHYMAPELLDGSTPTHTADIYGMGAILYELLTGDPPLDANTIGALLAKKLHDRPTPLIKRRGDVPIELSDLVDQCLEGDPTLRPKTARILADRLDAIMLGTALPSTVPIDPIHHVKRSPMLPIAIAIAIVVLVMFTLGLVARGKDPTPFAHRLASREHAAITKPVFVAPMVELAVAEPSPVPSDLAIAPDVVPTEPTPGDSKRRSKRSAKTPRMEAVTPEICDRDRERATNARREQDWPGVLANTRHASCWKNQDERRLLQVKAYKELGRFEQCIALGKRSSHPDVMRDVKLCEQRRGHE